MNKEKQSYIKLWNREMIKLQGKYPLEFCCNMNSICKIINDELLKSQRKEIIDKIKEENLKGKSIHEIVDLIEND